MSAQQQAAQVGQLGAWRNLLGMDKAKAKPPTASLTVPYCQPGDRQLEGVRADAGGVQRYDDSPPQRQSLLDVFCLEQFAVGRTRQGKEQVGEPIQIGDCMPHVSA